MKQRGRGGWGESVSTRWTVDMQMPHCPTLAKWRWGSYDWWGWFVCVRDGGRGARRQSLGTEPGMPSLEAKQEHGEPSREQSQLQRQPPLLAECAVPFLLLCAVAPLLFGLFTAYVHTLGGLPNLRCNMQNKLIQQCAYEENCLHHI